MGFLKSLFGKSEKKAVEEEVVVYNGFNIQPCPNNGENGWTTEAMISKQIEGETVTHHFIRADSSSSRENALELIMLKARTTIDQSGDNIFSR